MLKRMRADVLLVERKVFESRSRAQAAIKAGLVTINSTIVRAPSDMFAPDAEITASQPHPYVSRGGLKLAAALDYFGIDPSGRDCIDVGSSTGGFTDVLLRRGAAFVTAVDTGREQLHATLRRNQRVRSLESTDVRMLGPEDVQPNPTLAVIDVSFISINLVLPPVAGLLARAADIVALIKPQFEVGKAAIGKGGIVRDEQAKEGAKADVRQTLQRLGFDVLGLIDSPITGGDGNQEYLIAGRRS